MKTEISRNSHRPVKRYSGVYQQQGRMLTDADWNELMEIVKRRLDDVLRDIIGSGTPRNNKDNDPADPLRGRGVWIESDNNSGFLIKGSHLYADGVVAQVAPEDGVNGENGFPYDRQADFPDSPALPGGGTPFVFYADVWERTVTQLEDKDLLDAGLHGADTATRTQTMGQIKWCPADMDPEDEDVNPEIGDAKLTVELTQESSKEDECDPCAGIVEVNERTGNYLFRVEVHEVEGDANDPTKITLKWSSENGAEQFDRGEDKKQDPPPAFKDPHKVFEFFDEVTEKHLGVHLAGGIAPKREELKIGYPTSELNSLPKYVRRWDGFVVLVNDGDGNWSLTEVAGEELPGIDRGSPLPAVLKDSDDRGVPILIPDEPDKIILNLNRVILTLEGSTFVAGDYWLAPIREREHQVNAIILNGAPPVGIRHHYLKLAEVKEVDEVNGTLELVEYNQGSPEWRQRNFPPLTDLEAWDVQYETNCPKTIEGEPAPVPTPLFSLEQKTVQQALDRICEIAAEHIAYKTKCLDPDGTPSPVPAPLFRPEEKTVQEALDRICEIAAEHIGFTSDCESGLFEDSDDTVAKALNRICQIAAQHVRYTADCQGGVFKDFDGMVSEALDRICDISAKHVGFVADTECSLLTGATTVHQALNKLCANPRDGCSVTVGAGGQFPTLERAIADAQKNELKDLYICLRPGEHTLENGLDDLNFRLTIKGCGVESTHLRLGTEAVTFNLQSFHLEGVEVRWSQAARGLVLNGKKLTLESNVFVGIVDKEPLVSLESDGEIRLSKNVIDAQRHITRYRPWAGTGLIATTRPTLAVALDQPLAVASDQPLAVAMDSDFTAMTVDAAGSQLFDFSDSQTRDLMTRLAAMPTAERETKVVTFLTSSFAAEGATAEKLTLVQQEAREYLSAVLASEVLDEKLLYTAIKDLRVKWEVSKFVFTHTVPGPAVVVQKAEADTTLDHNRITGFLGFYGMPMGKAGTAKELRKLRDILRNPKKGVVISPTGKTLHLHNNQMTRVVVSQEMIDKIMSLPKQDPPAINGIFSLAFLSDNLIQAPNNHVVARKQNLTSNILDWENASDAGFLFGRDAVETGTLAAVGVSFVRITQNRLLPAPGAIIPRVNIVNQGVGVTTDSSSWTEYWRTSKFDTVGGRLLILLDVNFAGKNEHGRTWMRMLVDGQVVRTGMTSSSVEWDLSSFVMSHFTEPLAPGQHDVRFEWKVSNGTAHFPHHNAGHGDNASRKLMVFEIMEPDTE